MILEVYIDGSYTKYNGGGWSQYWGENSKLNRIGKLLPEEKQTCARAEVRALYEVLFTIYHDLIKGNESEIKKLDEFKVIVYCDNMYCVNGYNDWMHKWVMMNFPKEHPDLWTQIYKFNKLIGEYVIVKFVRAHSGILGNERADILAKQGAKKEIKS